MICIFVFLLVDPFPEAEMYDLFVFLLHDLTSLAHIFAASLHFEAVISIKWSVPFSVKTPLGRQTSMRTSLSCSLDFKSSNVSRRLSSDILQFVSEKVTSAEQYWEAWKATQEEVF